MGDHSYQFNNIGNNLKLISGGKQTVNRESKKKKKGRKEQPVGIANISCPV